MDGTRIADLADLSTADTHLFRVRAVDDAVASGAAALQSDERTAAAAEGDADSGADDGIAMPDDRQNDDGVREAILVGLAPADDDNAVGGTDPATDGGDDPATDGGDDPAATGGGSPGADAGGPADVACWLNYCQHMTHIKIDKGSGAPVRDGELLCANHGALFAADSGECTYGPCEGAVLTELAVTVENGGVYLVDEGYEYVGEGPVESDDDLSSSSNVIL